MKSRVETCRKISASLAAPRRRRCDARPSGLKPMRAWLIRRATCSRSRSNAPLTMKRMCRVLMVSRSRLPCRRAAAPLELEGGLELRLDVHRVARGHLGFLHELEQGRLHAAPADIAPADGVAGGGDLVHFVDVDDAVLRQGDVAVGPGDEVAHEVFHVAADVAGFAELGGVGLDEGHADQLGDVLDEVRLADAGRADEDDVLLGVFEFGGLALVCPWRGGGCG